jgi:D-alanine-D-alanine ligase-like ATP-grasp enzyme
VTRTFVCVETSEFFTRLLERVVTVEGDRLLHVSTVVPPWDGLDTARIDVRDDPAQVAAAIRAACQSPVAAVFTTQELLIGAVAAVSEVLGVARNPPAAMSAARDKARMKEIWQASGVSTPHGSHYRSRKDLDGADIRFPAVVKPTHGFASCGVRRVETEAELLEQLRKIGLINGTTLTGDGAQRPGFLIEQCLDGAEFSVDTVWFDGQPVADLLLSHVHTQGASSPYFPDRLYLLDRKVRADLRRRVVELTHAAVRALGISYGPTHTEVRFHAGTPYVLEAAARPGAGGMFYEMLRRAHGVDLVRALYLSQVCADRSELTRRLGPMRWQQASPDTDFFWYNMPYRGAGIIKDITGLDELRAQEDVLLCVCFKAPGDHLPPDGDLNANYFCNVLGRHTDRPGGPSIEALLDQYDKAVEVVY